MLSRNTRQVAELLNVPLYRIQYLLNVGKIPRPRMNASRRYEWSEKDVQQAKEILDTEYTRAA